jgi:hypothetical protein
LDTPITVIREALLRPVPCPQCASTKPCRCLVDADVRLEAKANIVWDALVSSGVLTAQQPATELTQAEIEEVAKYLAHESRFVRYSDDGWRMLLTSETDVRVAHAKAAAVTQGGSKEQSDALGRARDLLVGHIEQRRAAEGGE